MGLRILVAEPERQIGEALAFCLTRKLGSECVVATGYAELVYGAHQNQPHVILVSCGLTGATKDRRLLQVRKVSPGSVFIMIRDESARSRLALFAANYMVSKFQSVMAVIDAILMSLHYDAAPKRGDRIRNSLWARKGVHPNERKQKRRVAKKGAQKFLAATHNVSHRFGIN